MYLEKLETQGFKTFAQKTTFEFLPPHGGKRGITAIVGPNGSGKSNSADLVRWVLGEQSLKLLRGKKSEDIIFSGTEKKTRSGFAEGSLTFNNSDHTMPLEMDTVVFTRRLYREGSSEYLLNGKPVRLSDIQMLLAESNFGQRTYSVIGQGMVDHVLVASPQERKEFFDEAAGVKQFEIKRNQAVNKLHATYDNLGQATNVLHEIEPRLRSLNRQVKRLEQRGPLEDELQNLGKAYYGRLWRELEVELKDRRATANEIETRRTKKARELDELKKELEAMEQQETKATGLLELQKKYEEASRERGEVREKLLKTEHAIALAKMQAASPDAFPAARVMQTLESVADEQETLVEKLDAVTTMEALGPIREAFRLLYTTVRSLLREVTGKNSGTVDQKLLVEEQSLQSKLKEAEGRVADLQTQIKNYAKEEDEQKGKFFAVQRQWEGKHTQLAAIDQEGNDVKVALAKIETRREGLIHEIKTQMNGSPDALFRGELPELEIPREEADERFQKIKTQLEMIGSIDPETLEEHKETKERHEFLSSQVNDLEKAMSDLESAIEELDGMIESKAEEAFRIINKEFSNYFKRLFDGGHASLAKIEAPKESEDETEESETSETEEEVPLPKRIAKRRRAYSGIEIQATPPGKRLKSINALSGGERALTSIALICAIMASNPSPFVVLDEVDAALDESNSIRFADIVEELSAHTQFILITHNRATMHKASVLYGVTMGDDGISRVLSLKLEEAEKIREGETVTV
jgi:chromosome segregation ATPase